MIRSLILILSLLIATQCQATVQAPDFLLFEGRKYPLNSYPLELFFDEHCNLRPATEIVASDNYRGYTATYLIAGGHLFIHDVVTIRQDPAAVIGFKESSALQELFPKPEQRKLTWFSGLLVAPDFGLPATDFTEFDEPHGYLIFQVNNGEVHQNLTMSPEQFSSFKKKLFEIYRESDDYRQRVLELSKWLPTASDDDIAELIFEEGVYLQSADGKLVLPPALVSKTTSPYSVQPSSPHTF